MFFYIINSEKRVLIKKTNKKLAFNYKCHKNKHPLKNNQFIPKKPILIYLFNQKKQLNLTIKTKKIINT